MGHTSPQAALFGLCGLQSFKSITLVKAHSIASLVCYGLGVADKPCPEDWPQLYRPNVLARNQVGHATPHCSMFGCVELQNSRALAVVYAEHIGGPMGA
jgi:hypothetical protein